MKSTFIIVQNIAIQAKAPDEVMEWVDNVRASLDAVFEEIAEGKQFRRIERWSLPVRYGEEQGLE